MTAAAPATHRVLIIGWDGGTWTAFGPLVAKGRMPNLAALMARGCHGVMRSTIPPHTAPAWTTMLTGVGPSRHGVFSFFEGRMPGEAHVAGRDGTPLMSAERLKAPSLEDVLGAAGRRVMLVNLPLAWPPKPINGVMITGLLTPSDAKVFTHPPEVRERLVDYEIDVSHSPDVFERAARSEAPDDETLVRICIRMERARTENVLRLSAAERFDFTMILLSGPDRVFHRLWPAFVRLPEGRTSGPIDARLNEFVDAMDRSLGRLVEAFDDATILLLSDHGFGPRARRIVLPDVWLESEGLLVRRSGSKRRRRGLRRIVSRAIRGMLGERFSKRVLSASKDRVARMMDAIDPERSRCFSTVVEAAYGGVRLLGAKDRALEDRLIAGLRGLTDPKTGARVVADAWRRDDLYGPGLPDTIPDVIFEYREGYTGMVNPDATELVADYDEGSAGTHRASGMFVLAGHGVKPLGAVPPLGLADVVPLTLRLCRVAPPAGLEGRVPVEMLDAAALGDAPDDASAGPSAGAPQGANPYTADQERRVKDHLRRLGYL